MVVADLLKQRFNRGRDDRLCFFRDRTGNEVDLLHPLGPDFLPVEIKAGQPVSQDWFRGLKIFNKLRADNGPPGLIVYGGNQIQRCPE